MDVTIQVSPLVEITNVEPPAAAEDLSTAETRLRSTIDFRSNVRFRVQARLTRSLPYPVDVRLGRGNGSASFHSLSPTQWVTVGRGQPAAAGRLNVLLFVRANASPPSSPDVPLEYRVVVDP
jgi:hypothetical protein